MKYSQPSAGFLFLTGVCVMTKEKDKRVRIKQTKSELQKELDNQLQLLEHLCESYDNDSKIVAKSIATSIRVLLHDNPRSRSYSLLSQLGLKSGKFHSTAEPKIDKPNMLRVGSFSGLIGIDLGDGYFPYLDDHPPGQKRLIGFDEFWNEEIFFDQKGSSFSRKDIVLFVANQDGGSHVDPEIEEKYASLSRKNSLGWKTSIDNKTWSDLKGAELAAIRQIGHELLRTLKTDYPIKKPSTKGSLLIGGAGMFVGYSDDTVEKYKKVGRNQPCPCGSGKKYKKCHGSLADSPGSVSS